jgi:hypothetical protein
MKSIFRNSIFYIALISTFFIGGCYSELRDFEIGNIKWGPELGVPLVDSKFTLVDLLESNAANIDYSIDANNVIVLRLSDDNLLNQSASEYYALEDRLLDVPPVFLSQEEITSFNEDGSVTIVREVLVEYEPQGNLNEIQIDEGLVITQVEENFPANLELSFNLVDPQENRILDYQQEFIYDGINPISSDESRNQINNVRFQFNEDSSLGQVKFSIQISLEKVDQDLVFGANILDLELSLQEMEFGALYGDLDSKDISTNENVIQTDFLSEISSISNVEYFFENPQFKLIFTNTMGVPIQFDVNNFRTYKSGQQTDEAINSAVAVESSSEGSVQTVEANFDAAFKNIINRTPDSVAVQIDGLLDPNDTQENFVTRDSYLQIGYEANLPLVFSLNGLEINQTISLDGIDTQELEYALFKFSSENSLPIDLDFTADLLDEDSAFVMNLFEGRFLAGGTEAAPTSLSEIIRLVNNPDTGFNELEDLRQVRRIGIRAEVATTNNGSNVVSITSNANIQFNLALQAKYNVDLE